MIHILNKTRKNEEKTNRKRLTIGYKNDIGMTYHSQPLEPDKNFKFFHDYMVKKSRWILDDMGYDMDNYSLIYDRKLGTRIFRKWRRSSLVSHSL